jgi:hypothetical protein
VFGRVETYNARPDIGHNIFRIRFCVVVLGTYVGWPMVDCPISALRLKR